MSNKITPEIEQQILYLAANGEGIKSISRIINIPRSTLRLFIVKNGVILKDARHNKAPIKIDAQNEAKIRQLAANGVIATKIAEQIGLHEGTIRAFCKKKDIALTLGNEKGFLTKVTSEIKQQIIDLVKEGLNATEISRKIGTISKATVQNYVKENNLNIAKNKERNPEYLKLQDDFEKLLRSNVAFTEARKGVGLAYNNALNIAKNRGLEEFVRDRAQASMEDRGLSFDFIKQEVEKLGYKLISTEYFRSKDPLIVECSKHGQWNPCWNSLNQGQGCPSCSRNASGPQDEIIAFIKTIYSGTVIKNDWSVLKTRELDIWLPEHKIGIEYDGLFSHSEYYDESNKKRGKKLKKKSHTEKMTLIKNADINFLAFYGDEWGNPKIRPIIESIIKNKIGIITNKIHARKTDFVEITNKEAEIFLESNHLDGYTKCSKAFGLKYNGVLVMVSTTRTSPKGEREIARMATLVDHVVVGGASKLLSHIPKPFISYSDNRISNGEVYKRLGFEEITETFDPSYYYTDFKIRVFRTSCRHIKELPGDEREQAFAGHFSKYFGHDDPVYRIYDYGQRKWLLK